MTSYLLLIVLFFIFLITLLLFDFEILCPASIVCLVMLGGSIGSIYVNETRNYIPSGYAIIYITFALFVFIVFSYIAKKLSSKTFKLLNYIDRFCFLPNEPSPKISLFTLFVLTVVSIYIFSILFKELGIVNLLNYGQIGTLLHSGNFKPTNKLRIAFHLMGFVTIITYVLNFIQIKNYINNIKSSFLFKLTVILSTLIFIPLRLIRGGRMPTFAFFGAIVIAFYMIWHKEKGWNKSINHKYIIYCLVFSSLFVISMIFITPLIGRETIKDAGGYIAYYAGGAISSLDYVLENQEVFYEENSKCFTAFRRLINYLSVDERIGKRTEPIFDDKNFIYINGYRFGNVYTPIYYYWHDYGLIGISFGYAFTALFFGFLYYYLKNNSKIGLIFIIYHYSIICLLLFSFGEYFSKYLLSFANLETIFYGVVFCRILNIVSKNKKIKYGSL